MKKNKSTELKTIKQLSELYNVNLDNLYYLSSRKKQSFNQLKQHVFNIKYGEGDDYDSYHKYYLSKALKGNYKMNAYTMRNLKNEFFTDWHLSQKLTSTEIEKLWEKIMKILFKIKS